MNLNSLFNCRNNTAISLSIVKGEFPALSVFEPLVADLIPADLITPDVL